MSQGSGFRVGQLGGDTATEVVETLVRGRGLGDFLAGRGDADAVCPLPPSESAKLPFFT
jgi:hypothetical protein